MSQSSPAIKQKLALIQLADSFFPSGTYTLSHGLESLAHQDTSLKPEDIANFLRVMLHNKIAPGDLVALRQAFIASKGDDQARLVQIDAQLFAQTLIASTRTTQQQCGRALLMVAQSTWNHQQLASLDRERAMGKFNSLHPIVFGAVGNIAGLNIEDTAIAFLHGFVTGILGAAIRLGILGHLRVQQILLELAPDIEKAYLTSSSLGLESMWSCTPTLDLAQMNHGKLGSKLFAN